MPKLHIILASTRNARRGEGIARWALAAAIEKGLDAELVDLKEYPLPLYNEPAGGPKDVKGAWSNPIAPTWAAKVKEADGYLIVTPEYNNGYPAALKNALDWCYEEWGFKPVAFASYGGESGGIRSVQQLRQVVIELNLFPLRNSLHIPFVWDAVDADGAPKDPRHRTKIDLVLAKLDEWAGKLKSVRT